MPATGINKKDVSLYEAGSPFKCHFSALMWQCSILKNSFWTWKKQTSTTMERVHKAYWM